MKNDVRETVPFSPAEFTRLRHPVDAVFEVTPESLEKRDGELTPSPTAELVHRVAARLWGGVNSPRFALVHGALPLFARERGLTREEAATWVRTLRRRLCDEVFGLLCRRFPDVVNPLAAELAPIEFDLDGYNVNVRFMGDDIDFRSNKQLHFDIVEPLGSNMYGPNQGIEGGWPAFADGRAYCHANGLDIKDILDKIPGTRNLTISREHYKALVEEYTVAYEVDMVDDLPFTVFVNRVEEAGLLHGATEVRASGGPETRRPIRHYAWDNVTAAAAEQWYRALGQDGLRTPGDSAGHKPLVPGWLRLDRRPPLIPVRTAGGAA